MWQKWASIVTAKTFNICAHIYCQVNAGAFLKWLETHRMVFFKQTELYHNFLLCAEILDFASSKSTGNVTVTWQCRRKPTVCLETHELVTGSNHITLICCFSYYSCFVFDDVAEDLKWTPADQWLLRKCLGSVRGIQRFRSFLKGTAGLTLLYPFTLNGGLVKFQSVWIQNAFQTQHLRSELH